MDFSIVAKAGLTTSDVSQILGVSQVMAWKYVTGRATPRKELFKGRDLRARAAVMIYVLEKLVEKGSLPKPELHWSPRLTEELVLKRKTITKRIAALVDERVAVSAANK